VWESTVGGRTLHFHLSGINNQNFIMSDEETGSWWQQVTGLAILGPMKGQRLRPVSHDELTFGLWKNEKPLGRVLRPDPKATPAHQYASADWEARMTKAPVTTSHPPGPDLEPRALVIGLTVNNASKAYPFEALKDQSPIVDELGGTSIVILLGDDKRSVRAFERVVDGQKLEVFQKPGVTPFTLADAETGSEWNFMGTAVSGPFTGRRLKQVDVLEDYWFDWDAYHPDTAVYKLQSR
jgi:hypothetical protein